MTLLDATRRKVKDAGGPIACVLRDWLRGPGQIVSERRKIRDAAGSDQGSSLIEFGTTLGLLMTFVYVLMQISMVLYTYGMISECAREASRYASVHGSTCTTSGGSSCTATAAQINTYAKGRGFPNIGPGTLNVTTTFPNGNENAGSTVQVQITYSYAVNFPLVPQKTISLQVSSEMYILQ